MKVNNLILKETEILHLASDCFSILLYPRSDIFIMTIEICSVKVKTLLFKRCALRLYPVFHVEWVESKSPKVV